MRRIKWAILAAGLLVWIVGERWLRSKTPYTVG
jgi:hypothetical protein